MPDPLTPEEVAAIAAFPADRIQRIPRGVSGEPTSGQDMLRRSATAMAKSRSVNDAIRHFWQLGEKDAEIARRLNMTPGAVGQRRERMGLRYAK